MRLVRSIRLALSGLLLWAGLSCAAFAQSEETQRLDAARAALERIERALERKDLSDAALQALRADAEPVAADIEDLLRALEPRREAARQRLEQVGKPETTKPERPSETPKPAEPASDAAAAAAAERADVQKAFDEWDGLTKRARLLDVQADQALSEIANRRRALFREALFQRAASVLSPRLWYNAALDLPRSAQSLAIVAGDWASGVAGRMKGSALAGFIGALGALALFVAFARIAARRVLERAPAMREPSPLRKVGAALWVSLVVAVVPIAAALAAIEIARFFDVITPRLDPLVAALFDAVRRIAVTIALTRGLLAVDKPEWRLPKLSTQVCERLAGLAVSVAVIVSAMKILDAVLDLAAASVALAVLLRSLGALAVAGAMARALYGFGAEEQQPEPCDELGPPAEPRRDWWAMWRNAAWAAIVAISGACLIGYVAFANFLVDQVVWTTFVIAGGYLLHQLSDNAFAMLLSPDTAAGRAARASIGLKNESLRQIAILLRGAANVVILFVAVLLALAPWGIESDDMIGNLRAAFFGFRVGDVTISLSAVLIALILFGLAMGATRVVQSWLEREYLPTTQLDVGLRNSIRTSVGYAGFILALAIASAQVGMSFDKLAIVAGALSIGVGFGLQSIVNNFVSGLILLWERAIRVGDWVVVGDEQGYVRRINVRSTEIETFDRATMIVPNSNLVAGVVKNWVRTDRVGRIKIPVSVAMAAEPDQVRALLLECAKGQELVLEFPAPQVMFVAMADSTLRFELICFIGDVEKSQKVRSDLNFAIFRRFREAHIDLSPPPAAPVVVKIGN
jgi:small-conductance mechanosensitive channel